jgi:hypothetical protein
MKVIKNSLLVICFLSAFSIAAYATDSKTVSCSASPSNPYPPTVSGYVLNMTNGATYHWQLAVTIVIFSQNCTGYAYATIVDDDKYVDQTLSRLSSTVGSISPQNVGSFVNNDSTNEIAMDTYTWFSGSNGGGYAYALASVTW